MGNPNEVYDQISRDLTDALISCNENGLDSGLKEISRIYDIYVSVDDIDKRLLKRILLSYKLLMHCSMRGNIRESVSIFSEICSDFQIESFDVMEKANSIIGGAIRRRDSIEEIEGAIGEILEVLYKLEITEGDIAEFNLRWRKELELDR